MLRARHAAVSTQRRSDRRWCFPARTRALPRGLGHRRGPSTGIGLRAARPCRAQERSARHGSPPTFGVPGRNKPPSRSHTPVARAYSYSFAAARKVSSAAAAVPRSATAAASAHDTPFGRWPRRLPPRDRAMPDVLPARPPRGGRRRSQRRAPESPYVHRAVSLDARQRKSSSSSQVTYERVMGAQVCQLGNAAVSSCGR